MVNDSRHFANREKPNKMKTNSGSLCRVIVQILGEMCEG